MNCSRLLRSLRTSALRSSGFALVVSLVASGAMVACRVDDNIYVAPARQKEADVVFEGGTAADKNAGNTGVSTAPETAPEATCGARSDVGNQRSCSTECGSGFEKCIVDPESVCNSAIVVSGDDTPLSPAGFGEGLDAAQFAKNILDCFAHGKKDGRFLARSQKQQLSFSGIHTPNTMSSKSAELRAYNFTIDGNAEWTLENLKTYDGVFFAGLPYPAPVDMKILKAYVEAGGHVYIAGGGVLGAVVEADVWNRFLPDYGLEFGNAYDLSGPISTKSEHPLFKDVGSLYQHGGTLVILRPNAPPGAKIVVPSPGETTRGYFGVYDRPSPRWGACSAPQPKGGVCDKPSAPTPGLSP